MNWKKVVSVVLLFTLCFAVILPSNASADNFIDPYRALYPSIGEGGNYMYNSIVNGGSDSLPLHLRYPIFSYALTTTALGGDAAGLITSAGFIPALNMLLSMCMQVMAAAALIVIALMNWAFGFNGLDGLADTVDSFVKILTDKLFFGELTTVLLFFLGIALMFAFGRNEDVAGKLLKVIFNLILAFTILFNMGTILKFMDYLGETGSSLVLTAYSAFDPNTKNYEELTGGDTGKSVLLNMQEKFWKYNVLIPWQLAQFGEYADLDDKSNYGSGERREAKEQVAKDTKKYLTADNGLEKGLNKLTSSGKEIVNGVASSVENTVNNASSLWNGLAGAVGLDNLKTGKVEIDTSSVVGKSYITMTVLGFPFRMLMVFLTFIIGTAYGCLLLAISGTIIVCQLFMYMLAIFGPIILLLTWLPEMGDKVLLTYVQTFFAAAVYNIVAIMLFVAILFMQGAIYDAADDWIFAMFAQIMLVFTVFLFRGKLADFIPIAGLAIFQGAEDQLFKKSKAVVEKTIDTAIDIGKTGLALGAAGAGAAVGMPGLAQPLKARGGLLGNILGGAAENAANDKRDNSGPTGSRDTQGSANAGQYSFGQPMPGQQGTGQQGPGDPGQPGQPGNGGNPTGPNGNGPNGDPNGPRGGGGNNPRVDPNLHPGQQNPGQQTPGQQTPGQTSTIPQFGQGQQQPGQPGQPGVNNDPGDIRTSARGAVTIPNMVPGMTASMMQGSQGVGGGVTNIYNQSTTNQYTTNQTNQSTTTGSSAGGLGGMATVGSGMNTKDVGETKIIRETTSMSQGSNPQTVDVRISGQLNVSGPGGSSGSVPLSGSGSGGSAQASGSGSMSGGDSGGGSTGGGFGRGPINTGSVGGGNSNAGALLGGFSNTGSVGSANMDSGKGMKFSPSVGSGGGGHSSSYDGSGQSEDEEAAIERAKAKFSTVEQKNKNPKPNVGGTAGKVIDSQEDE